MDELEAILSNCPSIDDFLKRPALVDAYFAGLEKYYDESRMNRKSYDEIVRQLAELIRHIPELKTRVWEKRDVRHLMFSIETWRAEGRDVRVDAWNAYVQNWRNELLSEFKGILPPEATVEGTEADQLRNDVIRGILTEAIQKIKEFESVPREKKEHQLFYKSIRASKSLIAVASFFIYRHLTWETMVCQRLLSGDGDIVLNQLRELKENPRDVTMYQFREIADPVLTHIKDRIPALKDFLEREDLFPLREGQHGTTDPSAKSLQYSFEPSPRRFHDVFIGIPTNDCLCGGLGDPWVVSISAVRWAVCLLEGAYTQHIRSGTKYLGSVRMTPLHRVSGRSDAAEGWMSLELHCPSIIKRVIALDPAGEKRTAPLFMFWLHEALQRKAASDKGDFKGFVVGQGNYFDNHKVLHEIRTSPAYVFGKPIGPSEEFAPRDPLAKIIPEVAVRRAWALNFRKIMLFDATEDAGNLVELHDWLSESKR